MALLLRRDANVIRIGEVENQAERDERQAQQRKKSHIVDVPGEPVQGRISSQVGCQYVRFVLQCPKHKIFAAGFRLLPDRRMLVAGQIG